MPSKSKTINPDKKTAMQTFNDAWKYLDKKKLSKEEKITLLNLVHTSYYLWQQVPECNATNTSISLWQISKAYAHIGDGTCALLFAVQNIKHSKTKKTDGFYIAYAYESAARAYWILKEKKKAEINIKYAMNAIKHTKETHLETYFKDIEELKIKINSLK
ncbi:MAG: hypothetical protein IPL21_00060 [Saprospirales bacterium]|nr:hypothetical protein [Saprospirales bacterium]